MFNYPKLEKDLHVNVLILGCGISGALSEFKIRKDNNFAVSFLDKEMIESKFGFEAHAAILSELGAQTNAYVFTHSLHQFNINNGCKVNDRTKITTIKHDLITAKIEKEDLI